MRGPGALAAALVTVLGVVLAVLPASTPSYAVTPEQAGPGDTVSTRSAAGPRLRIPAIGVSAGIIKVGVRRGQLDIGGSVRGVYRWRKGVRPGQPGSAVLAGHTWSKGPGVFDRLGQLRPGNVVTVGIARFKITRVRRVRRLSAQAVRNLYSDRGRARLVLITCGDRNDATGVYRTRIIVSAKKVPRPRHHRDAG